MNENIAIWPPHEVFYLESMATITRTATSQLVSLLHWLDKIDKEQPFNPHAVLDNTQNIINAAGALSRYFWPSAKTEIHQKRGHELRSAFNVDDNSVLKDRQIRNFVEHFDENLDKFLRSYPVGTFLPTYVGYRPVMNSLKPCFFRAYYPDENVFCVLSHEYAIDPIVEEMGRLHTLLLSCLETGRLP